MTAAPSTAATVATMKRCRGLGAVDAVKGGPREGHNGPMSWIIAVALLGILAALASAGLFMLRRGRDEARARKRDKRMARALAVRVALSVALFLFILLAWSGMDRAQRHSDRTVQQRAPAALLSCPGVWLKPVDDHVQAEPDHVDEVPVPGGAFEAEVALSA